MEHLYSIADKIFYIIILMGTGILVKKMGWVSDEGEKDLSHLSVDFIWPSMIFSSVVTTLTLEDILANLWLPVLSIAMHLVGYGLGLIVCRMTGYRGNRRQMFLFHAALNNFFLMALPFAQFFLHEKGVALLAVANLGSMLCLWVLGVYILAGNLGLRRTAKNICSPGLMATVLSIVCVLTGLNRFIPELVINVLKLIGEPTMFIGMMIAGTQVYKLGRNALKFDGWNLLVGLLRNIVIPAIMLGLALLLKGTISREALVIFTIVSITPASVNSVNLALKYDSAPDLAAEGVIFTHILAIFSMLGFVLLIERLIL